MLKYTIQEQVYVKDFRSFFFTKASPLGQTYEASKSVTQEINLNGRRISP